MRKNELPPAFRHFVGRLLSDERMSVRHVYRFLIIRWTLWSDGIAGNGVPGYDSPPPAGKGDKPAGWSEKAFAACKPDTSLRIGKRKVACAACDRGNFMLGHHHDCPKARSAGHQDPVD